MITNYNKDQGTFILPISNLFEDQSQWERLCADLGSYTTIEIDYDTKNFSKVDVDYSLHHFKNLKYAKQELNAVYSYVLEYLNISTKVDKKKWENESDECLAEYKAKNIAFYKKCLAEIVAEGVDATYSMGEWHNGKLIQVTKRKYNSPQEFADKLQEINDKLKQTYRKTA